MGGKIVLAVVVVSIIKVVSSLNKEIGVSFFLFQIDKFEVEKICWKRPWD